MKRALTPLFAVALLALPLVAEEAKKTEAKPAQTDTAAKAEQQPAQATTTQASAPAQEDSPLVAAAKRTNRLGKKPAFVITNETLKKHGEKAHVTTTEQQADMYIPPPHKKPAPTPEMRAAKKAEIRRAEEARVVVAEQKKQEAKQQNIERAADADEELYPDDDADPAQREKALQDAHAEETKTDKKPPVE